MSSAVATWATRALRRLDGDEMLSSISEHIDQLGLRIDQPLTSWSVFYELLDTLTSSSSLAKTSYIFAIAVHLDSDTTELTTVPASETLLDEINLEEPPSLWIRRRIACQAVGDFEEYSCTLPDLNKAREEGLIQSRFSAIRDARSRDNGWEYNRLVWFEYVPKVFLDQRVG